jgi:hypothetical protein
MFSAPGLVFGGTEAVGSLFQVLRSRTHFRRCRGILFHVLCSRTRFRRYRGRQVPFSCFAHPDSFSTIPSASGPNLMFCAHGLIFGGAECVWSRFHVLRSRTRFWRYWGRQVPFYCFALSDSFSAVSRDPFSSFALPDSFSAIPGATGPFFLFCALGLIFGGSECVGSHFHVLRSQTRFRRY